MKKKTRPETTGPRVVGKSETREAKKTPEEEPIPMNPGKTLESSTNIHLAIQKIPEEIMEIVDSSMPPAGNHERRRDSEVAEHLHTIFHIIYSHTGRDFSSYKESTVMRRIGKRMAMVKIARMEEYIAFLKANPDEAGALSKDILIKVTYFFRDPLGFEALQEKAVPQLFAERSKDNPLRIWIAGCSTGEEAFSVAIIIREYMLKHKLDNKVQIFATDIDEEAIAQARTGIFPSDIGDCMDTKRLRDYFRKTGDNIKVAKSIREMIVFARHDIIHDPPFDRIDLLVCRNFLIYLSRELQERIIPLFFHALKPGGTLFLGTAETLGDCSDLFLSLDKKWKIFKRKDISRRVYTRFPAISSERTLPGQAQTEKKQLGGESPGSMAEKIITERYSPPFVIINERHEITYYSSGMERFVEPPKGEPTRDILKVVRKNFRPALRAAIYKAVTSQEAVSCHGLQIRSDGMEETINIKVEPFTTTPLAKGLTLVIFESAPKIGERNFQPGKKRKRRLPEETSEDSVINQLEEQLRITSEQLQATIENQESSNEELRSSNEELMSMNEEFQSANEELETSREELQTLNDELARVNSALEMNVEELARANNDMMNLMSSSETATIFLDPEMNVKNFTPAVTDILNVILSDIGRPLSHLSGKIDYPEMRPDAEKVLRELIPAEREVKTADGGKTYLARILPYRTVEGAVEGVVVTFFDITDLRHMEKRTRHLASFPQLNPNPILEVCSSGNITFFNPAVQKILESLGMDKGCLQLFLPAGLDELLANLQKSTESVLYREVTIKGKVFAETVHLVPQFEVARIYGYDITERRRVEEERETTVNFLHLVNKCRGTGDLVRAAATFFQQRSGCEAVGIRLKEGDDYPYFEVKGFPRQFVAAENLLCDHEDAGGVVRDGSGNPVLECMCGNVIKGRFDPSKPFFTNRGSFWTNSTTELLSTTSETDRKARTRNRCHGEGYESVALIPLRFGDERLGLVQLNDRQRGHFSLEQISFWERLADHLAVSLAKFHADVAMRESEKRYRSLFENMLEGFAYCKMLYDDGGYPVDFVYLDVNNAFGRLTGLENVVGKKVTEVIPGIGESYPELLDIYSRVALTGRPEKFEIEFKPLDSWLSVSVYSMELEYFVAVFENITERKRVEEALRESEERWQFAIEGNNDGVWDRNLQTGEVFYSRKWKEMLGFAEDEIGNSLDDWSKLVNPEDRAYVKEELERHFSGRSPCYSAEYRIRCKDSSYKWVLARGKVISLTEDGKPLRFVGTHTDITEKRILEAQLYQAQKMEAVGQLAGGIAHDFNNILTAIIGYSHLAQMKSVEDDPMRNYVVQIQTAAERAAELTQGLLAFSRKQVMMPKVVNLNEIVVRLEKMLRRLISESVDLKLDIFPNKLNVMVDSGKIEQVLMNLATNARDAMPDGGNLTIATFPMTMDSEFLNLHGYGKVGEYACISVNDTGCGIDSKIGKRIFEPFFTTKEVGKGTGLGLSIVYGIVKQHNGYIFVDSGQGRGTTFKIYLQLVDAEEAEPTIADTKPPAGGNETILLVEDDSAVRDFHNTLLKEAGYKVITAGDGHEALGKFAENEQNIDILVLDVIMPRMGGKDAYNLIRKTKPDVKVLFLSGYPVGDINEGRSDKEKVTILAKPVAPNELLKKVREVIDS